MLIFKFCRMNLLLPVGQNNMRLVVIRPQINHMTRKSNAIAGQHTFGGFAPPNKPIVKTLIDVVSNRKDCDLDRSRLRFRRNASLLARTVRFPGYGLNDSSFRSGENL